MKTYRTQKNQVNNHAMHKFSKNLCSWKSAARKDIAAKPDIDIFEIQQKWPTISVDDWNIFQDAKSGELSDDLVVMGEGNAIEDIK